MANIIYNKFFEQVTNGSVDLDAAGTVVRCMLERAASTTYVPNKDHSFVSDLTTNGFGELNVPGGTTPSYLRQTVTGKTVTIDPAFDRVEFYFGNVSFGNLETGNQVKGIVFYVQTGGSDATPADDSLICYIDTATGLPATLGGGQFLVTIDAQGLIQFAQG